MKNIECSYGRLLDDGDGLLIQGHGPALSFLLIEPEYLPLLQSQCHPCGLSAPRECDKYNDRLLLFIGLNPPPSPYRFVKSSLRLSPINVIYH